MPVISQPVKKNNMNSLLKIFMPKNRVFYELFEKVADNVAKMGGLMKDIVAENDFDKRAGLITQVEDLEHANDELTHSVFTELGRNFITPFDRSDIKDLIVALDDSIDQMQKTAKAVTLFEVTTFDGQMRDMGDLIVEAAKLTVESVSLLSDVRKNNSRLNQLTEKITHLEEAADALNDQGLKALFKAQRADPMAYIAGAEIYDHLEKVMDRFEDVANRISAIVIEHV